MDHLPAATVSFLVAVTNNYTWNRLWTFAGQRGHVAYQGIRFLIVAVCALVANLLILETLIALGLDKIPAQAIAVNKDMGWDTAKVNVNGGAIAIGHPIGASGARILTTLLHEMGRRDAKKGLATLCIGGGMGVAMCLERN